VADIETIKVSDLPIPIYGRSEEEIAKMIRNRVEAVKGVRNYDQLSIRMTEKRFEVDMLVSLDDNLKFEDVHRIASNIESAVRQIVPNARVTINTEPLTGRKSIWKTVKKIAEEVPGSRDAHNIHVQYIAGKLCLDFHLQVSEGMTVRQAHGVAEQVEKKLRATNPSFSDITIHIESASDRLSMELTGIDTGLQSYIEHAARSFPEIKLIHGIKIHRIGESIHVDLRCHFDPNTKIERADEISSQLENAIKKEYPRIERVDIHEEPA
jgi:divalent metal cation (Fe/Co/Zn/Cd) transporter